jgi:nucleotide-binding universal stress UspA family protein
LIERQLRAHARFVQRLLAETAARTRPAGEPALRWSFRTVRGAISSELLSAARDSDLILLGKTGWSRSRRLGSTARALAAESPILAFILHQIPHPGRPVMVAYDGSPDSQVGLTAARLISGAAAELNVLILAEDIQTAQKLKEEVEEHFASEEIKVDYRWISSLDAETIDQTASMAGCEVLVLPAESRFLDREALLKILNESKCSVLLVR